MIKLNKSTVDATKPRQKEYMIWDGKITGLGLRVYPSGRKVFIFKYRIHRRSRQIKIGVYGPLTPDQARKKALKYSSLVTDGVDPQKDMDKNRDMTVAELCDLYLKDGVGTKKKSTIATDVGRIKSHIIPLLGNHQVVSITMLDVERFQRDIAEGKTARVVKNNKRFSKSVVRGGKGTASRTVGLLGGIFTFAKKLGLIDINPVHGVVKYKDNVVERILTDDEWHRLGKVLSEDHTLDKRKRAALHLIAMTGCRKGEVANLKWSEVNISDKYFNLSDTKTGHRIIPLGDYALNILKSLDRIGGTEYVFPGKHMGPVTDLTEFWKKVCVRAGVKNCRLHDMRHQFASLGVRSGEGDRLFAIANILGHKDMKTTKRYAHLASDYLQGEATDIAGRVAKALGMKTDE